MAEKAGESQEGELAAALPNQKSISNVLNLHHVMWFADPDRGSDAEKGETKDTFGPPLFDEKSRTRRWRIFKRGFVWGKWPSLAESLRASCLTVL